jgi:hypothetical protein
VREDRAPIARDVRDSHRADDAVVVELVADPVRVRARGRNRRAEDCRVRRVERLGGGAAQERGDAPLELACRTQVPSMNRTAPGPAPNVFAASSAACSSRG